MSVRHFCDRCDHALESTDFDPFIRVDIEKRIIISVVAMLENNQVVNDLCNVCKLDILANGTPSTTVAIPHIASLPQEEKVATLQPVVMPGPTPPPPAAAAEGPKFVPSLAVQPTTLPTE